MPTSLAVSQYWDQLILVVGGVLGVSVDEVVVVLAEDVFHLALGGVDGHRDAEYYVASHDFLFQGCHGLLLKHCGGLISG